MVALAESVAPREDIPPVLGAIILAILWGALAIRHRALVRSFTRNYLGFGLETKETPDEDPQEVPIAHRSRRAARDFTSHD